MVNYRAIHLLTYFRRQTGRIHCAGQHRSHAHRRFSEGAHLHGFKRYAVFREQLAQQQRGVARRIRSCDRLSGKLFDTAHLRRDDQILRGLIGADLENLQAGAA